MIKLMYTILFNLSACCEQITKKNGGDSNGLIVLSNIFLLYKHKESKEERYMKSGILKTFSLILIIALLINLCPAQALAMSWQPTTSSSATNYDQDSLPTAQVSTDINLESASILAENVDNRTEFSKEYKLNNGLNLKVVYPEPVHYSEDGLWKDIDNTLKLTGTGTNAAFINTADSWNVMFPQNINNSNGVSITSDGHTISFRMDGELKKGSASKLETLTINTASGNITVQSFAAQNSIG